MAHSEEDEWEYEYDDTETEDFYIPVDVANVPQLQTPVNTPSQRLGHPWLLKTKLRAFYVNRKETETVQIPSTTEGQGPATMGEIQAIGLHTSNPLIMYNGQLLSCQWVSALGTDLLFAKPKAETEGGGAEKPLRALPEVDLIALSSARLVARVGRLRPKDELFEGTNGEPPTLAGAAGGQKDRQERGQQATQEDEEEGRQGTRPTPSTFLAKLNAAKAKRGETSRLVLSKRGDETRLVSEETEPQPVVSGGEAEDVTMSGT
ncbi:hypothetical protein CC80DRAFT_397011 [Byssothecium circinans]|uniref:Transcription factor TFIIIC triple barrel domain-containing protein n=1 Tax=Byssothecium circinans TaxID=147558 RepID=A0A6A5UHW3_9PLEO|nr:hypothetical protein CC80DRAFT_397011 [Byssothecium circinans]